jgi:hypothetical protein
MNNEIFLALLIERFFKFVTGSTSKCQIHIYETITL